MERQPDVEVTVVQHCHLLADVRKYTCDLVNRVRGWSLQPCVVFPDMRFLEIVYRLICSLSNVKSNIFTVHHWNLLKGTIIPHLTITSCNIYLPLSWPNPQAGSPCVSLGKYGLPWLLLTADYVMLLVFTYVSRLSFSFWPHCCVQQQSTLNSNKVQPCWLSSWIPVMVSPEPTMNPEPLRPVWTWMNTRCYGVTLLTPAQMAEDKSTLASSTTFQWWIIIFWQNPLYWSLCPCEKNTLILCWNTAKTSESIYCIGVFNWYNPLQFSEDTCVSTVCTLTSLKLAPSALATVPSGSDMCSYVFKGAGGTHGADGYLCSNRVLLRFK